MPGVQEHTSELQSHDNLVCLEFRRVLLDRKSTRLNSSHTIISYAVFCLTKQEASALLSDALARGLSRPPPGPPEAAPSWQRAVPPYAKVQPVPHSPNDALFNFFKSVRAPLPVPLLPPRDPRS